jgi:hypothetical protein
MWNPYKEIIPKLIKTKILPEAEYSRPSPAIILSMNIIKLFCLPIRLQNKAILTYS